MPLPLQTHPLHRPPAQDRGPIIQPPILLLRHNLFHHLVNTRSARESSLLTEATKTSLLAKALSSANPSLATDWSTTIRAQWHEERALNPSLARQARHKARRTLRKELSAARKSGVEPTADKIEAVRELLECRAYVEQRWWRVQLALGEAAGFGERWVEWREGLMKGIRSWCRQRGADKSWRRVAVLWEIEGRMKAEVTAEEFDAMRWAEGVRRGVLRGDGRVRWPGRGEIEEYKRRRYGSEGSRERVPVPEWRGRSQLWMCWFPC